MIKVFINTLPVNHNSGGIKTFLIELLHAFSKRKGNGFQYCLICSRENESLFEDLLINQEFSKLTVAVNNQSAFKRIFFEQFMLNRFFRNQTNALLLNICNIALLKCAIPQVTIIQAPLSIAALRKILPRKYAALGLMHKIYYDSLLERSIKISKRSVAVSHFMKEFIPKDLQPNISVIHEGVNVEKFSSNVVTVNYNFPERYILCVSTLFPYKNMDKAIMAFSLMNKKIPGYKLVIVGKDPDGNQKSFLTGIAKEYGVEEYVILKGLVPYADIPAVYKKAKLFLFLSSVETFGLPVLEAMVCNIPVIASNKMSIPEIVQNAGYIVDPENIKEIAESMEYILANNNERNRLINAGAKNISNYNWDKTAYKFEQLFSEVI